MTNLANQNFDEFPEEELDLGREFMREYEKTFRALAKQECSPDPEEK
jgi:hypothetical protein